MSLLIECCAVLTLAAHLMCVNLASAGPLMVTWLQWKARRARNASLADFARFVTWASVGALLVGAALGCLLAGLMWIDGDRALFAVLPSFSRKIYWGLAELAFYFVCVVPLLSIGRADRLMNRGWAIPLSLILSLLASTNLLYHFPALFTVMAAAAERPSEFQAVVTPAEFRELMMSGPALPLSVHFWLASFAVTGLWICYRAVRRGDDAALQGVARTGAIIALLTTALQLPVGIWILISVGTADQQRLLGEDLVATGLIFGSVVCAFLLLHLLAGLAFGTATPANTSKALHLMVVIIVLMSGVLRQSQVSPIPVRPVASGEELKHRGTETTEFPGK